MTIYPGYGRILSVEGEVTVLTRKNKKNNEDCSNNPTQSKKYIARIVVACALVLVASLLFFFLLWLIDRYDDVQFDQILYSLKAPVSGTSSGIVVDAIVRIFLVGIVVAAAEILLYLFIAGRLERWLGKFKGYLIYSASRMAMFFKKTFFPMSRYTYSNAFI